MPDCLGLLDKRRAPESGDQVVLAAPSRCDRPSPLAWLDRRERVPAVAWADDLDTGFEPTSSCVETYWLPTLGPSATWALRRIAGWLRTAPGSGVGAHRAVGSQPRTRIVCRPERSDPRALGRLVDFRMARIDEDREVLVVRTVIPPLGPHAIRRLPGTFSSSTTKTSGHTWRGRREPARCLTGTSPTCSASRWSTIPIDPQSHAPSMPASCSHGSIATPAVPPSPVSCNRPNG